jgi:glycosyltransferase involved in cell wall biosynthesis
MSEPLGEALLRKGLLTPERLEEALALGRRWRMRLGDVVTAKGFARPIDVQKALAERLGLPFVDLRAEPADPTLLSAANLDDYVRARAIPWRRGPDGTLWFASADPQATEAALKAKGIDGPWAMAVATSLDLSLALQERFRAEMTAEAVDALWQRDPTFSAKVVMTPRQKAVAVGMVAALAGAFALAPLWTAVAASVVLTLLFVGIVAFKGFLCLMGAATKGIDIAVTDAEARAIPDEELPTFTILVPMYKEPDVLPILAAALRRLDYPISKLDIKLVLEEDDADTIEAARRLGLEGVFQILRVPPSQPRTKPKACNYALALARGEFCVIYDAEDKPEPDQLRKVVAAFRKGGDAVACIQARLNYFNARENVLTRLFALDYALWFDHCLPALDRLGIPIPLGGTSNHFRTDLLRALGGWDPYNVTEDADLGARITQKGFRVGVVNSTTWEEACSKLWPWIRQRSRWMKGYAQTWLVHMRHPVHLWRSCGWKGFLGFQAFVGGTVLSCLLSPVLWLLYLAWLLTGTKLLDPLYPGIVMPISLAGLLVGNAFFVYMAVLAPMKRPNLRGIALWGLLSPVYWLLASVACWRGVLQLLDRPHHWEKTPHGISAHTAAELKAALE